MNGVPRRTQSPELGREAVLAIDKARERIRAGNYVTGAEAKERLGF